jgi:hypothetical protein
MTTSAIRLCAVNLSPGMLTLLTPRSEMLNTLERMSAHGSCQHDRWLILTSRGSGSPATPEMDRYFFNTSVALTGADV